MACQRCVCHERGRITRPPGAIDGWEALAALGYNRFENFLYAVTTSRPQVESSAPMVTQQQLQSSHVRLSQIRDVNVIPDRCTVGRIKIASKHCEVVNVTLDCHHSARD